MQIESLTGIRHALEDHRRKALTDFIKEFMPVLISEGYSFEDLVNALADWADEQKLNSVVGYLEKAAQEVSKN